MKKAYRGTWLAIPKFSAAALFGGWMIVVLSCAGLRPVRTVAVMPAAAVPPAGLKPDQVPQFVSFGSDDNARSGLPESGRAGGLHFLTEIFASRRNPAGSGSRRTFDDQPLHYSFYVNTRYIAPSRETGSSFESEGSESPVLVKRAWKEAIAAGHEIGVHTHSHFHGSKFTLSQWKGEIERCVDILGRPFDASETPERPRPGFGMGVSREQLLGFRTPFLEYNDLTLTAVGELGFEYDCSLEEGFQDGNDGTGFLWPYRLDFGSPGNLLTHERYRLPRIGRHAGLWEIPVYALVVPPDSECPRYGLPTGLRTKLKAYRDYFDVESGEISGMDWNLWNEFAMTAAEFTATLKYNLDLRRRGNRCPLTVGIHSQMYSDGSGKEGPNATPSERRRALVEFLDHSLRIPEARVVSAVELLRWLRDPQPLE